MPPFTELEGENDHVW